jgi:hypothetical protein
MKALTIPQIYHNMTATEFGNTQLHRPVSDMLQQSYFFRWERMQAGHRAGLQICSPALSLAPPSEPSIHNVRLSPHCDTDHMYYRQTHKEWCNMQLASSTATWASVHYCIHNQRSLPFRSPRPTVL